MGHAASAHDYTAWKSTTLYRGIGSHCNPEEYILADKAYALERHIITPYMEPAARQPSNAAFNYELSIPLVKIEHVFGVLKARWPTLWPVLSSIIFLTTCGMMRLGYKQKLNVMKQP
ncbi:hypothetical protein L211DRAFT_894763 [Terfezia boudieri ATCC MYA-4762]|uniref:DDE Tnp4 domain-containing protein n=1 Tax=Terfezia boudieri ATCC MYA-4762 TaxID=1051890 RepID=A0A3N4M3W6_9PEZI|nr:hypothetical protein L211DRAFT_894763 [Terfezia boudieri ATCC MYA-4762]